MGLSDIGFDRHILVGAAHTSCEGVCKFGYNSVVAGAEDRQGLKEDATSAHLEAGRCS